MKNVLHVGELGQAEADKSERRLLATGVVLAGTQLVQTIEYLFLL